jgi:hypothetical protein
MFLDPRTGSDLKAWRKLEKRLIVGRQGDEYHLSDSSLAQLARYDEGGQLKLL